MGEPLLEGREHHEEVGSAANRPVLIGHQHLGEDIRGRGLDRALEDGGVRVQDHPAELGRGPVRGLDVDRCRQRERVREDHAAEVGLELHQPLGIDLSSRQQEILEGDLIIGARLQPAVDLFLGVDPLGHQVCRE